MATKVLKDNTWLYTNGDKFKCYCIPNINHIDKGFKGDIIYHYKGNIIPLVAVVLDVKADDIFFLANDYDLTDYTLEAIANLIQNLGVDKDGKESK